MQDWAALLRAIAALLWPLLALGSLFYFKAELRALLARIKKGKLLGQEIEFQELDRLDQSAKQLEQVVASLPTTRTENEFPSPSETGGDDTIAQVLKESAQSPKAALLLLAAELEREVRHFLAASGHHRGRTIPFLKAVQVLDELGSLPRHISDSVKLFWNVRNRIVHGGSASSDDILRAIDSGITILNAIRSIPRETNRVYHPGVDLFVDADCKQLRPGIKAVILDTTSPGGVQCTKRAFPTTRTHFEKGKLIAWEWNYELQVDASWYRDPDTNEVIKGWDASTEFVGRHLDEV